MKIYIAGKITGDPNYKAKFQRAEKKLRDLGHSVMNPAWICASPEFDWEDYMKVSKAMQKVCEATVLLPDWYESRGAREEYRRARNKLKHHILEIHCCGENLFSRSSDTDLEKTVPPLEEFIHAKPEK